MGDAAPAAEAVSEVKSLVERALKAWSEEMKLVSRTRREKPRRADRKRMKLLLLFRCV